MIDMRDRADEVLQRIAALWSINPDRIVWVQESERDAVGFDWWPGDYRVRVRAFQGVERSKGAELKVSIVTDFLKDLDVSSGRFHDMAAALSAYSASTYAWVYVPQRLWQKYGLAQRSALWFSCAASIGTENMDWMTMLLAQTGIYQPINAQVQAEKTAEFLGTGVPDASRPERLRDAGLDGVLHVIEEIVAPQGAEPSRWAGTAEFAQFVAEYGRSPVCYGTADESGMTLETPFGDRSAAVRFSAAGKHPQLGHGLRVTLLLPFVGTFEAVAEQAALMNCVEASSWTDFPQLGLWHCEGESDQPHLAYSVFMPNAVYRPGLATNIAFWMVNRARWTREQLHPDAEDLPMPEILHRRHNIMQ
jgi:hypothetical protein